MSSKRICIIGAGLAGLGSIKSCLEEDLVPFCYEAKGDIGGLWRYTENSVDGEGCVMRSTIINTSKEMSSTSDFLMDETLPNYMHNKMLLKQTEMLCDHFNLKKHISFYHRIISVTRAEDYDQTGRWRVKVCNIKADQEFEEIFDGVMVCSGHHAYPIMPTFPGQDKFKGKIIHTHGYKNIEEYMNQNIVVVGVGNSGIDAAVELSHVTNQAYLSSRSGAWVLPRMGPFGYPIDMFLLTRFNNCLFNILPYNVSCTLAEKFANFKFDHKVYGLKPKHRFHDQHPTVHDGLANRLISGTLKVKKNIKEFTEDGVIFENETAVTPVDTVVMATGYKIHFPYLGKDVMDVKDNKLQLFKYVFPTDQKHPTMAFIGYFQTLGPGIPPGEMQIRWTTRVLSGKVGLPKPEIMRKVTKEYFKQNYKRFGGTICHTIHVDVINYMDEIASLIGVKPNMFKMMLTDPKLFYHCFFGPCLPFQYRLVGPGAWKGARDAILLSKQRVIKPLRTTRIEYTEISSLMYTLRFVFFVFIMFMASIHKPF